MIACFIRIVIPSEYCQVVAEFIRHVTNKFGDYLERDLEETRDSKKRAGEGRDAIFRCRSLIPGPSPAIGTGN
jgi:hypothetical protein